MTSRNSDLIPVKRALISVSDKTGVVELARKLAARGVEILSTGGTAATLRKAGVAIVDVSEFTGAPEILDGRVKTLHPKVHGGILHVRGNPEHEATCREHGIEPIDLVVVNLYPFRETIRKPGVTREEAVEQIDIGGPTLLRSSAKNHADVAIVCRSDLYDAVIDEIERNDGSTTLATRRRLALEAFRHTSEYDTAIASYFSADLQADAESHGGRDGRSEEGEKPPVELADVANARRAFELRYGENSHQPAAFYGDFERHFEKLWGLELSYNNILDLGGAVELIEEFTERPAVAIIKHTNPCGVALGDDLREAWARALACDETSAFGGIVAANRPIDAETAEVIHPLFTEIIAAPGFSAEALAILKQRKNRRLLRTRVPIRDGARWRVRSAAGGLLVQAADLRGERTPEFRTVTKRPPSDDEMDALLFAWRVVKHVKSNAIVFTSRDRALGIGAGQMSRVDSARIAIDKARAAEIDLAGSVVASDAFFPFPDGLVTCVKAGAVAAIQPGGSRNDDAVTAAADEHGIAMVFTSERHFRH